MGMRLFSSGNTASPNPDPFKFEIVRKLPRGRFSIVMVKYAGCTTFGGIKVSVYEKDLASVESAIALDPHFDETHDSPIARFRGDEAGWDMAVRFVSHLN